MYVEGIIIYYRDMILGETVIIIKLYNTEILLGIYKFLIFIHFMCYSSIKFDYILFSNLSIR